MNKYVSFLIIIILLSFQIKAQEISNVHFVQIGKIINIYYDLSGEGIFEVTVYCIQDGSRTQSKQLKEVTGDVGKDQSPGKGKTIIWDVLAEIENLEGNIAFKIEALKNDTFGTFFDQRDGTSYKWVKIGEQVWMAENLNYKATNGSWCYDNTTANCTKFGTLYEWKTAKSSCPLGWHTPSDEEWCTFTKYLDVAIDCSFIGWSESYTGYKIKSNSGWYKEGNGSNSSSFSVLPGGFRLSQYTSLYSEAGSYFWTSSQYDESTAWYRSVQYDQNGVERNFMSKEFGLSVRCIKD